MCADLQEKLFLNLLQSGRVDFLLHILVQLLQLLFAVVILHLDALTYLVIVILNLSLCWKYSRCHSKLMSLCALVMVVKHYWIGFCVRVLSELRIVQSYKMLMCLITAGNFEHCDRFSG